MHDLLKNIMLGLPGIATGMAWFSVALFCRRKRKSMLARHASALKSILLASLFISAAAQACNDESREPISACRAEVACGKRKATRILGTLLSGMGQASGGGRNQAMDQYNLCVNRNLDAQRANLQYKLSMRALDQAK